MTKSIGSNKTLFIKDDKLLPSVSIDCIILGFNNGELQVLLNKFIGFDSWMLPGGFVFIEESVNDAAIRILRSRTNIESCYLKQFYTFGETNRVNITENEALLKLNEANNNNSHWLLKRFISIGYYALVNYDQVVINCRDIEEITWIALDKVPTLYADHNNIIKKGIQTLKSQISYLPVGLDLLPEKFIMSELRTIYETILQKKIDRRNFQRKMLSSGLVVKLEDTSKKWGIKDTALFSFDKEKYMDAFENGISLF